MIVCVEEETQYGVCFLKKPTNTQRCSVQVTGDNTTFAQRRFLKRRVKIYENASITVACDHPSQDKDMLQFTGRYCTLHYHRVSTIFHGRNQYVNMKYFCLCSTDEHTFVGLE
ncbi:hypothetical protein TNCV_475651 [Trichonephila clavipes]|nr:hypothetical protein TNCV_475651 [Trichonephila clavipes]